MKYNQLDVDGHKNPKRVGRGISAGQGKTAGRGTKGQNSRTGSSRKPGFEGGQNPISQRLPKLRGFRSYKTPAEVVYTGQLEAVTGKTVDTAALAEAGLVTNAHVSVKLLVKGDLKSAKTVKLQSASTTAVAAVEKAGGTFERTARTARTKKGEKLPRKAKKQEA